MKIIITTFITLIYSHIVCANDAYKYEPTTENPYGLVHPDAPDQVKDFEKLMGTSDCKSTKRNNNQEWDDEVDMLWTFKYILNGLGVQDTTLKSDGVHTGSIRLYDAKNQHWQIHYYSSLVNSQAKSLQMWTGGKKDNDLVFYRENKAPNGMEGFYRLTFKDITNTSFNWVGEWVDSKETMSFPTWKISCQKQA